MREERGRKKGESREKKEEKRKISEGKTDEETIEKREERNGERDEGQVGGRGPEKLEKQGFVEGPKDWHLPGNSRLPGLQLHDWRPLVVSENHGESLLVFRLWRLC